MKMKPVKEAWRNAATLIIAAKSRDTATAFNYKVLCMKRSEKTSFLQNNLSFPGGRLETQDETLEWLKYFQKTGTANRLQELNTSGNRPLILQNQDGGLLQRNISLRIAAIRETFEELGVLICKNPTHSDTKGFYRGIDVKHYQNLVHNHQLTFLDMCKELNVVPDLWRLREWSNWLTPTFFRARRFDTMFFIMTLQEQPPVSPESNEAYSYMWRTPSEYLKMSKDSVFLPPPQFYEFSRLRNIKDIDALENFATNREKQGLQVVMPVQFRWTDGIALVLPGDDAYPKVPQYSESVESADREVPRSLEEFRFTKNVHRTIVRGPHDIQLWVNIQPVNGHLSPNLTKSKL